MRIYAEWIPQKESYRVYNPEKPQDTLSYEDNIKSAIARADEYGYDGLSVCDTATIQHIELTENEKDLRDCFLERATGCRTKKELDEYLDTLSYGEYIRRVDSEPEEYINYFDQVFHHPEWQLDLSKVEQAYLDTLKTVLRSHLELWSITRFPLHDEIPFIDREVVKEMAKKHHGLSEAKLASAVNDYSPYTIIFHDKAYGLSMAAEIKKENVR